jgi:hypothetical protein
MVTLTQDLVVGVSASNYTLMIDKHMLDKKGNPKYETLGYYGTLASAVSGAREYCIRKKLSSDVYTLEEAIKIIKHTTQEFSELLSGLENGGRKDG